MLSDRRKSSAGVAAAEGGGKRATGQPLLGSSQLKRSEKKVVVLCLSHFW